MKRKTSSNKTEGKRNYSDTPRENEENKGKFSKPSFYSTAKRERSSDRPGNDRKASTDRPYSPREERPNSKSFDKPEGRRDFSNSPRSNDGPRGKFSKPAFKSTDRRERTSDRPDHERRERSDRPFTPRDERPGSRFTERTEEKRSFSSSSRSNDVERGKFSKPSFNSSDRAFTPRDGSNSRSYDKSEGRRDFSSAPRSNDGFKGKFSKPSFKSSDDRRTSADRSFDSREIKPEFNSEPSEGRREFSNSPKSHEGKDKYTKKRSYKKAGGNNLSSELPFIPGMPKVHNPHKLVESKPSPKFSDEVRLNKYISNAGVCSRRKADELIGEGLVQVNGTVVQEMGFKVKPEDIVTYQGKKVINENKFYVLLNKPKDFITTTSDERGRKTIMELVKTATQGARIYPIGRLDRNTTGLILLTNDGELAQHLSHPSTNVIKVYQAELDKPIEKEDLQTIRGGVELEDGFAEVDEIDITTPQVDARFVGVAIHSGKNRIVRRIFEHLGYEIKALDRVTFAGLTKKDLPRGKWRYLTEKELVYLKYLTAGSVKR